MSQKFCSEYELCAGQEKGVAILINGERIFYIKTETDRFYTETTEFLEK